MKHVHLKDKAGHLRTVIKEAGVEKVAGRIIGHLSKGYWQRGGIALSSTSFGKFRRIWRTRQEWPAQGRGAQRRDYGILSLHSLQSTSDQTDYVINSYIAANVVSAVTPEQAGMWVYPYRNKREHVIYNMVNGLLLRPYVSGLVWNMSEENLKLMREGISLYKEKIRKKLPQKTCTRLFEIEI